MLAVAALPAARKKGRARRHDECGGLQHRQHRALPCGRQRRPRGADTGRLGGRVDGIGCKELGRVRPQIVERALHPRMRRVRAVAQANGPVGGVLKVIARFLGALAGDRGKLRVARRRQRRPQRPLESGKQEVAQNRAAEVDVRQLADRQVAVLVLVSQESERILVAPAPFERAGVRQQQPRLTEQIQRGVGERDVLLDHRTMAAPLR